MEKKWAIAKDVQELFLPRNVQFPQDPPKKVVCKSPYPQRGIFLPEIRACYPFPVLQGVIFSREEKLPVMKIG